MLYEHSASGEICQAEKEKVTVVAVQLTPVQRCDVQHHRPCFLPEIC